MRVPRLLLLLALAPLPLLAQGGMGGMGGMNRGGMGGGGRSNALPKFATAKEIEKFNAADALLNDERKLKLTVAQVAQLSALRATLFERNADLLVRYDSVRRNFRPPRENAPASQQPSQEALVVLGEQMRAMMTIMDELMARRPDQVAQCLALVDDTQKDRATDILKDQTNDLRKQVPEFPDRRRR